MVERKILEVKQDPIDQNDADKCWMMQTVIGLTGNCKRLHSIEPTRHIA